MIRLPWANHRPRVADRRAIRPSLEGLEGRLLLSRKGAAAIARARNQAGNSPVVPPLDTPLPTINVRTWDQLDPSGFNITLASKVKLIGSVSSPFGVVYLGRGPRGAFTTDTVAAPNGHYEFDIQSRPGDNLVRVFVASASAFGVSSQYSPVLPFRFVAADAVVGWDAIAVRAIMNEKLAAPEAARDLATLHVAQYDAIASIRSPGSAIRTTVAAPKNASEAAAANAAAYAVLTSLFPNQTSMFDQGYAAARTGLPKTKSTRDGLVVGGQVAAQTLAWRSQDETAPFVVKDPAALAPAPPPAPGSAAFDAALAEVQSVGETYSTTRTDRQTLSARFWNNIPGTSTNPGMWNLAAGKLAVQARGSLWANARTFAMLNAAMADAGSITQATQATDQVPRPITVIQQTNPDWTSYMLTPSSFSYNSDQAAYASAAASVLSSVFGANTPITIDAPIYTSTRVYASANEAAIDAADSGIYGGVQYRFDVTAGSKLGSDVAQDVMSSFPAKR